MSTARIVGLNLSTASAQEIAESLVADARAGRGKWVVTLNLEMVSRAARDKTYAALLEGADMVIADGMPLVWASKRKRGCLPIQERVTGADLTKELIADAAGLRVLIVGGEKPRVALEKIGVDVSRVEIFDGAVETSDEHIDKIADLACGHGAQIVFLALGVPKQDKLAHALRQKCPSAVLIGVGGTFELIGGQKPRAPEWMQKRGMEWLFRLKSEPGRLWRRYLLLYPSGVRALLKDIQAGDRPA